MLRDHFPTALFCGSFGLTRGRTMPPPTLSSIVAIGAPRNEREPEMRTLGSQVWILVVARVGRPLPTEQRASIYLRGDAGREIAQ
jgi:hypothetical protein